MAFQCAFFFTKVRLLDIALNKTVRENNEK